MLLHKNEAAAPSILAAHYHEIQQLAGFASGIVVDIGANVGSHSIVWSRSPKVEHIHAFEPHPRTFLNLCANLLLNDTRGVKTHECALGAYNGAALLSDYDDSQKHFNMGSYVATKIGEDLTSLAQDVLIPVEMRTLDSFALSPVHFIKIDTEGYEFEILRGASGTLKRESPIVFVEVHYQALIEPIKDFMGVHGYTGKEYLSYRYEKDGETAPLTWGYLYWKKGRIVWENEH
jgi:FkbM family methyltransferase